MFNLNGWEIVIVAVLFIILFGPERLPEVALQIGRWVHELRQAAEGATAEITREFEAAAEEARLVRAELEGTAQTARRLLTEDGPLETPPAAAIPERGVADDVAEQGVDRATDADPKAAGETDPGQSG